MRILIWHSQQGPAAAFTIPEGKRQQEPQAYYAGQPNPRPWRDLNAKGPKVSWDDWADHLLQQHPYFGWWSVEEIPDSWQEDPRFLARALQQAARRSGIFST